MGVNAINEIVVNSLLPAKKENSALLDILPKPEGGVGNVNNLLTNVQNIKGWFLQFQKNLNTYNESGIQADNEYRKYLQFPNSQMKDLASQIVEPNDSDDAKMEKIQQWVMDNITYVADEKNYGSPEYWAMPVETLNKESGDCEDGAFLIHSLALNAGVDPSRLRTYGGLVETAGTAPFGGHAWTAYQRESDDEWIAIDWCYYPTTGSMDHRQTLADDDKYFDDWFFVDLFKTEDTTFVNTMRGASVNLFA
jgi:predicted transglutaminase-like cysteine proteinase